MLPCRAICKWILKSHPHDKTKVKQWKIPHFQRRNSGLKSSIESDNINEIRVGSLSSPFPISGNMNHPFQIKSYLLLTKADPKIRRHYASPKKPAQTRNESQKARKKIKNEKHWISVRRTKVKIFTWNNFLPDQVALLILRTTAKVILKNHCEKRTSSNARDRPRDETCLRPTIKK